MTPTDIKARLDAMEAANRSAFEARLAAIKEAEDARRVDIDTRLSKLEEHVIDDRRHLHDRSHGRVRLVVDGGDPFVVGARSPKHRREGVRRAVRHALKAGQQIFRYLVHVRNVGARLAGRSGK